MGKPLNPKYRLYHPKWYRSRIPIFWWLGKLSYTKFIGRELTSEAEVGDLDADVELALDPEAEATLAGQQHDVARLEVPVADPPLVGRHEAVDELTEDLDAVRLRDGPPVLETRCRGVELPQDCRSSPPTQGDACR